MGSPMDVATINETIDFIDERVVRHEFTQHVVVNVAKLVHMQSDAELRRSVEGCDVINIDGMGIIFGGRLLGIELGERVAGIDLFARLVERSAVRGYPIFLLGAKAPIVAEVARRLQAAHPTLRIAGFHDGYFWDNEEAIVDTIRGSGARLLFVAITSPRKEKFIARWRAALGVDFVMGVGGTFDVVAGAVSRAPPWMQQSGLEWLYRVIQEPRRMWRRYLSTNISFAGMIVMLLIKQRFLHGRRQRKNGGAEPPFNNS
jgi:N-acetylglucosaminyldiphosphoundecaprenol N-acetyl-beta-D-mannosaminyltransferase